VVLGTLIAWAILQTGGREIPLVFPWARIAVILALAVVMGVLAAVWPARRAARLNVLEAIKTE